MSYRCQTLFFVALCAAVCTFVFTIQAQSQTPKTLAEIPLISGAEWVEESGVRIERSGPEECSKYTARKPIEDVVKFYAQRWQAREAPNTRGSHGELEMQAPEFDAALERLRPGQSTPVFFTVGFWLRELYENNVKEGLPKRPPYHPNQWIDLAEFHWAQADAKGNVKMGTLEIEDVSTGTLLQGPAGHLTFLTPCVIAYGTTTEEMEEEASAEKEEPWPSEEPAPEVAEKPSLKSPSEKDLGVSLYAGARYDAQMSTGMSQEKEKYYVYLTNDPVAKVVAFYESKTGKKALTQAGGSYLIVLRGRAPWPELGIMIQPVSATSLPQYIGTANSVITIRKEL